MQYHYNQLLDFLNDDSFIRWALFGENESFWQSFLEQNAYQQVTVAQARQLIHKISAAEQTDLPTLDQQAVWSRIQVAMEDTPVEVNEPIVVQNWWQRSTWRWAASIALLIGISWFVWRNYDSHSVTYRDLVASVNDQQPLIERVNDGEKPLRISLEDGSAITLTKHSKISYPSHFTKDRRRVLLSGEAFFDIAKDPSRPFYVYANELVTKVLGTSFWVRAYEQDKQVLVNVRTGRVSVFKQPRVNVIDPETTGLVLEPNQQAVFSRQTENLTRRLVEQPLPLPTAEKAESVVRFDEVPVPTVLKAIEKRYGVDIIYNEDVLANCVITTKMGDESLYDKLDLICKVIGATYKEVDAQIVLESKGCQ
ncbi:FecR family protein [Spirosoma panaciterrae]|uniref:FecR family protein n=1 Tax=Spirosoma panaciterrae TaxID=496058 RepID=UPI000367C52C|nr:FecR family protein [Spirosoma panaciterrae]